jgi:hypothetical protein
MRRLILATVLVLVATVAQGQTVNPASVTFDHVDYATASRYELGYFALAVTAGNACDLVTAPASMPLMVDNLGKPTTTTGVGMSASLVARPIGCYVARVRALDASGLYSDYSLPSDPFVRRPSTVAKPVLK